MATVSSPLIDRSAGLDRDSVERLVREIVLASRGQPPSQAAAEAGGTHVAVETLARWSASSAFWAQIVERTTGRGNQPSSSP